MISQQLFENWFENTLKRQKVSLFLTVLYIILDQKRNQKPPKHQANHTKMSKY